MNRRSDHTNTHAIRTHSGETRTHKSALNDNDDDDDGDRKRPAGGRWLVCVCCAKKALDLSHVTSRMFEHSRPAEKNNILEKSCWQYSVSLFSVRVCIVCRKNASNNNRTARACIVYLIRYERHTMIIHIHTHRRHVVCMYDIMQVIWTNV